MPSTAASRRPCACSCRAALERPGQAHAVVVVVQIARGSRLQSASDSRGSAAWPTPAEFPPCAPPHPRSVVDQHLVPIDLQVRHQPNAPRPAGSLPVRSTTMVRSRPAGKPTSSAMRCHAVRQLRLNVRRDGLDPRLPRRIKRGRAEVVHIAGHQQPQRSLPGFTAPRSSVSACRFAKPS
jgi:hypothetical protein